MFWVRVPSLNPNRMYVTGGKCPRASKSIVAVSSLFHNKWKGCKRSFCFISTDKIFYLNLISSQS